MLKTLLQLWAGAWFVLNKLGLSRKERTTGEVRRRWTIRSWACYLIGLPAWFIIFVRADNWLVLTVEAVCIVPIVLIIYAAAKRHEEEEAEWTDWLARAAVVVGIALSAWKLDGFNRPTQLLELGSNIGMLVGAYQLRRERLSGYLWFLLMNGSMGVLMFMQDNPVLGVVQAASLVFVLDAYRIKRQRQ